VLLLAILFALGTATPLFKFAYGWLPGFRWVRTPARVFLPASLAVAVLAGLGAQRLVTQGARWWTPAGVGFGALAMALGMGLAVFFGQVNRAALGLALLPPLAMVVLGLTIHRRLSPRLALTVLTLLIFADLASFDLTLVRFLSPAQAFAGGEKVAAYLAGQPGLFRIYSPSYSLPSHVAAQAALQTADGVEPVHLAVYDRFMALAGGYTDPAFSVAIPPFPPDRPLAEAFRDVQPDLRLLGLLNVEYLASAFRMDWPGLSPIAEIDGTYLYRNQHALPRAWVVDIPVGDAAAQSDEDWATQLHDLADQSALALTRGDYAAHVTQYQPDRIEVELRSPGEGLLVLSEIVYPGWRAMVDGQERPVQQVSGILRGVAIAGGEHRVVASYDPPSVRWGKSLSLIALVGLLGWGGSELWRWKRPKPTVVSSDHD
jgi:hypothetical protein